RHLNTLIFTVALIVLGVLMSLAAPTAIINVVPYLMALWIFNHRLFTGIIAVVVFFLAAVVVVVLGNHTDYPNWFLASVGSPAIIMVFVRVSIELGARQQERSERLVLAAQREELADGPRRARAFIDHHHREDPAGPTPARHQPRCRKNRTRRH